MRIGIYDPYLDDIGGGEKYMMTIASCLSSRHEVSVFWDNKENVKSVAKRFALDLDNLHIVKNIFSPEYSSYKRLLATKKYDALIILSDGSLPLTLSKNTYLHVQQPIPQQGKSGLKEKLKSRHITKVFYNSRFTAERNKHLFPGVPTEIVYPPVQLIEGAYTKENIILHVGRFRLMDENDDFKKQHFMLDAFKKLVDGGVKDWKFVLAAAVLDKDKEAFAALQESVKGYPVSFIVNASNDKLSEIYGKAKLYWHASGYDEDLQQHPELAEHFGISTVEAMSAGAVAIVINAGGQKEIVTDEENGLLWKSLDELIEKTQNITKDTTLWKRLSENGINRAKDFSAERFCKQINQLVSQ